MNSVWDLDSADYWWLLPLVIVTVPVSFLGVIIVGGNLVAISMMIALLAAAFALLLIGLGKWQSWEKRLFLTLCITAGWYAALSVVFSTFRDFC
jgi:hypothetical protein